MKKRALLIEINYKGTKHETKSEISIYEIGKILKEKFKYMDLTYLKESSNENDIQPTKENILSNMKKIVENSGESSEIWIHFIGHSTILVDSRNEYCPKGLVPLDYEQNGFIYDDELKALCLSTKCKMMLFLDCCYGNYGFNLGYSMKMIEGRYIKEQNNVSSSFLYSGNTTLISHGAPENNPNQIFIVSMYLENPKNKRSLEKKEISNLLSRRFAQLMQQNKYRDTIDKFVMKMFRKMYDELYFLQTMLLSSNKHINGNDLLFYNYGNGDKLDLKYNLLKSDDDIKKEKEIYNQNRKNEFLAEMTKLEVHKIKNDAETEKKNVQRSNIIMQQNLKQLQLNQKQNSNQNQNQNQNINNTSSNDIKKIYHPQMTTKPFPNTQPTQAKIFQQQSQTRMQQPLHMRTLPSSITQTQTKTSNSSSHQTKHPKHIKKPAPKNNNSAHVNGVFLNNIKKINKKNSKKKVAKK